MIADSYYATCYIENNNGDYHMECDMMCGDKSIFSDYDGTDFIGGLNEMMNDMTEQMTEVLKEETPEEKIARLEETISQLQIENKKLTNVINDFNNNKNNVECQCKKQDNTPDYIWDILSEIMEDGKNYNWLGKEVKFK